MDEKEYLTIKATARMLGVSRSMVYDLIKIGKLTPKPRHPLYRKGGPVGIPRAEVEALLPKPPAGA